jgi:SAM-dependent methyltransferase
MASNLYGYTDYHGPQIIGDQQVDLEEKDGEPLPQPNEEYDDEDDDPLRSGLWMEGDSLAPPCGSSVSLIHSILEFASVSKNDVLYDFGCGDGRICLEALVRKGCKHCVGIEVEEDLVAKSHNLIANLPDSYRSTKEGAPPRIQVVQADLRNVLKALVERTKTDDNAKDDGQFGDFPMPTIIILYLLPESIAELEEHLLVLLHHARIVCNTWGLSKVKPIESIDVPEIGNASSTSLFLYTPECFERLKGFDYMLSCYNA